MKISSKVFIVSPLNVPDNKGLNTIHVVGVVVEEGYSVDSLMETLGCSVGKEPVSLLISPLLDLGVDACPWYTCKVRLGKLELVSSLASHRIGRPLPRLGLWIPPSIPPPN